MAEAYKGDTVRLIRMPERMAQWYPTLEPNMTGLVLNNPTATGLVRVQFDRVTIYLGREHYEVVHD